MYEDQSGEFLHVWILCLEGLIQFQKDEEIYRYYQIPLD